MSVRGCRCLELQTAIKRGIIWYGQTVPPKSYESITERRYPKTCLRCGLAEHLPAVGSEDGQRLLVAGQVGDDGVVGGAAEDGHGGAKGERPKLGVAHLKDKACGRAGSGIGGVGDAAKVWKGAQGAPEVAVFGEVGERARVVLEIREEAACEGLPGPEAGAVGGIENDAEQVAAQCSQ